MGGRLKTYQVVKIPVGSTWGIVVTYGVGAEGLRPEIYQTADEAQAQVNRLIASDRKASD